MWAFRAYLGFIAAFGIVVGFAGILVWLLVIILSG